MFRQSNEDRKITAAFTLAVTVAVLFIAAGTARAQARLQLRPVSRTSSVRLVYHGRSKVIDLDQALAGTNGTMPGEPPHHYSVWFTAERNGFLYLVAKVCSASPVSSPTAPCGGDRPCAILWIKIDRALTTAVVQSEIYESCSYNYYDSSLTRTATNLSIRFGATEKKVLAYDNREPDKGLVVYNQVAPAK